MVTLRMPYRLSFPAFLPCLSLFQLGFKRLRVSVLAVLVQDVHQVGDVAGGQPQSLDLGQLGVGRDVGDALPELREGRIDALGPSPLLAICGGSPLYGAWVCVVVVVHADRGSVHRDAAGPRDQMVPGSVVVVVARVQAAGGVAPAVGVVLRAVARREAVLCG